MNDFQASDELTAQIEVFEGRKLVPYVDPAGFTTWGIGHRGKPGEVVPQLITDAQADALLSGDLSIAGSAVRRLVEVEMTQAQFDGLTDFTFNLGAAALAGSSMLASVNRGEWEEAAQQCLDWDHAHVQGRLVELAGLKIRRQWDSACMMPLTAQPKTIEQTVVPVESILPPDGTPPPPTDAEIEAKFQEIKAANEAEVASEVHSDPVIPPAVVAELAAAPEAAPVEIPVAPPAPPVPGFSPTPPAELQVP